MWEARKQMNLQKNRQEKVEQEVSFCAFNPDISKSKNSFCMNDVMDTLYFKRGLVRHFERVDLANRLRKRKIWEKEEKYNQRK